MKQKQQRRPRRSERDTIASGVKALTRLLLWEASGGSIPLPKGMEDYKAPQIAFSERLDMVKTASSMMLTDLKVDPEDKVSGFDLLRGEYGDKRGSGEDSNRGIPSPIGENESASESAADTSEYPEED